MKNFVWFGFALLIAGCGDNDAEPLIEGEVYRYVVGAVYTPTNNVEAREYALDVDFAGTVDNQFGMVLGTLSGMGFDITGTIEESVLRGNALSLVELQTLDFLEAPNVGVTTHLGTNPDPAACSDPLQLGSCGRHLATRAHYDLQAGGTSMVGYGAFTEGILLADTHVMPIQLGLDPSAPLRVDLHAARIKLLNMTPSGGTAIFAGGFTMPDVRDVIIPEVARQLTRIVETECGQPSGSGPCECTSRALVIQTYFDGDDSCDVMLAEVHSNRIVQSLLAPDVRIDGEELLTIGYAATLVPAAFESDLL